MGNCGRNYAGKDLIITDEDTGIPQALISNYDAQGRTHSKPIPVVDIDMSEIDKKIDEVLGTGCCGKHENCKKYK